MRKIYILLFTLAAACCFTGCTREDAVETAGNGDVIIRLEVDGLETKSAANADENYVESLQVLVFKDVDAAPAKYLAPSITAGAGPFEQTYATVTAFGGFTTDELKTATVFAVANYSGDLSSVTSLADAKAKTVNADGFLENTAEGWDVKDAPRFVMTAQGGFTMGTGTDAGKAVANLTLRRLASKVSINVTYASLDPNNPITTEDEANKTKTVWTPMTEGNVRVYLANAVNNGKLEGYADTPVRFTYTDNHPEGEGTLSSAPFYTYPTTWNTDSDDAPYIKIIQPWSYTTVKYEGTSAAPTNPVVIDQNVVELYYKVMFPGITALASNTWYKPTVTLNVLGGESNRNMVELSTSGFDILPWGSVSAGGGELSPIEIEPAKYIAVEREHTIVNNGGTVSIKYIASGPTTLTVEKIHKMVYGNTAMIEREIYPTKDAKVDDNYVGDGGTGSIASGSSSDPWFGNSYGTDLEKPKEGVITLKHKLSSIFGDPNFAARPYIYKLKLHLNGEPTDLDKIFYITQNPLLLVEGDLSDGYVNVNDHVAYQSDGTLYPSSYVYTAPSYTHPDSYNSSANNPADSYKKATNILLHGIYTKGTYGVALGSGGYVYETRSTQPRYDSDHSFNNRMFSCNLGTANTYADLPHFLGTTNKCEYRIIVKFSPISGYYIMDPRIEASKLAEEDDFLNKTINYSTVKGDVGTDRSFSPFSDADDAENSIHKAVKKYSPAKRISAEYLLAPEIMVASSYGRTSSVFYESAVLRCAAYQEDGYPAGRWRLPTEAEIRILIELSRYNAIPNLFDGEYFASSGRYFDSAADRFYGITRDNYTDPNPKTVTYDDYRHGARCVYDTWYWGRDPVTKTSDGSTPIKPGSTLLIKQTRNGTSTEIVRNLYNWSGFMTTK